MAVYTVYHERLDTAGGTRALLDKLQLPFPAAYDGQKILRTRCAANRMPDFFLLSHTGRVTWRGSSLRGFERRLAAGHDTVR